MMLAQLKSIPCHLIVIGHEHSYDRYTGTKQNRQLVESRIQPISTSGPHGKRVGTEFNDVLRFYREGIHNWIDMDGNKNKDAGSRFRPPGVYQWDQFQFVDAVGEPADKTIIQWEQQDKEQIQHTVQPNVQPNLNLNIPTTIPSINIGKTQ